MRNVKDLDWSDVLADADRMMAEQEDRLEREIGPMHWVMDEQEVEWEEQATYWADCNL